MLAEPTTTLTDYLLAALCMGLAVAPLRGSPAARAWAGGLLGTAVAAAVGGTIHGFAPALSPSTRGLLWAVTYAAIGLSNLGFLAGAALHALPSRLHAAAAALLLVRLAVFAIVLARDPTFRWVVLDLAVTLGLLAAFAVWGARRREPWWTAVAAGVAWSVAGAAVQASGRGLHVHFNHNDIFHVLQMASMVCLQRAALRLR